MDGFQVRAKAGFGTGVYFSNYMVEGRLSPQGITEAKLHFYNVSYVACSTILHNVPNTCVYE